jgi:hypothetical protein
MALSHPNLKTKDKQKLQKKSGFAFNFNNAKNFHHISESLIFHATIA